MTADSSLPVNDPVDGVRIITLNRPQAHNAIDMAMAARLAELLDAAAADPALRCLVITGAGDKAFSAGFDIKEMNGFDAAAMRDTFVARDPLLLQIAQSRLPIIAALNGLAFGAGALIAAACDFRVACPASEFKVTAINYGSANATWSLPRIVGAARAKDILMTGRKVGAEEGLRIGLFDRLAARGEVLDLAIALAQEIAAKPPAAVAAAKALVDQSFDGTMAVGWQREHQHVLATLEEGGRKGADVFAAFGSGQPRS